MGTSSFYRITVGAAVVMTAWALPLANLPAAGADPCPDVEVVFARGTTEPPGPGGIGQTFIDSLRSQLGGRTVGVYAVNYPASRDFETSTPAGAQDASAHIQATAANCPNTRLVLGGYSQGAAVIDLSTTAAPAQIVDHVAAAALFGAPRSAFADTLSPGPLPTIAPQYVDRTIDLCVPNDPICSDGGDMRAHTAYIETGMVDQAATFAANRI
ncbi:cutinase [Mycobacterium sp. OAS707]|uniref:cutinase family protein n=1 Tax=Mycobacterium sp. OAS707 TaxID=2663822 RepID=UPI00178AB15F|nr:cutinase [Mycobacterium sp. OAS707]